jgi:hypothetical protein
MAIKKMSGHHRLSPSVFKITGKASWSSSFPAKAPPVAGRTIAVPGEGREKPAVQAGFFSRPGELLPDPLDSIWA